MADISEVKLFPLRKEHPKIKANGSFIYDKAFRIKFTLFNGPKGLFVSFPGKYSEKIDEKTGKKIWYPDVSCQSEQVKSQLNEIIISEYNKTTGNTPMNQGEAPGPTDQTKGSNIPF